MGDDTMGISEAQASSSAVGSSGSFLSIDWGDNEECPICRKPLGSKSVAMPDCCSHFFCYACIKSWVTKSKSNCPMDRMDISLLKIFDNSGKFKRTEKVEAKEQEDEVEFDLDDEGICPDCGWMGMRATVGVCMHCMYHMDSPFPVQDCPQCMENDVLHSDTEWTPQASSNLQIGPRRRTLRSSNNQHVIIEAPARASGSSSNRRRRRPIDDFVVGESDEESDHSVNLQSLLQGDSESDSASEPENEEVEEDLDFAIPGPSTSRAPPAPRPVRRTVKRVTKKRRTTVKRKRKTKTKRRKTTGTKTRRKRKVKRKKTTRGRKKVSTRPTLPDDSAKRRLAKILGVRPPKLSGQMMPRGCRKKPVTAAQRQALADASGPSNVYNRAVGSLDYHNNSAPTLHLFGGEELEYFPSGSDSDGSSSSSCDYPLTKRAIPSSSASVIKKFKNNAIKSLRRRALNVVAATASVAPPPTDLLSSIMEGQSKKFEIKSNLANRIDPYKMSLPTVSLPPTPPKSLPTTPQKSRLQRRSINFKKSPGKEDDLDLYSDIPAAGGAGGGDDAEGDGNDDADYLYDAGAAGSSGAGGDDGGDEDKKDFKKNEPSDDEEETKVEEEDDDDAEGGEEINEMVIDESVFANDELPSPAEEEAIDPLEVAPVLEAPVESSQPHSPPLVESVTPLAYPIAVIRADTVPAEVVRPVFQYSSTSLQIARHLTVDDEVLSDNPEEPDDYPDEPVSDVEDPLEVKSPLAKPSDEVDSNVNSLPVVIVNHISPKIENTVKVEVTNGNDLSHTISPVKKEHQDNTRRSRSPSLSPMLNNSFEDKIKKPPSKVKSRKMSLVEELFGSDVEENLPPRKISTDKSGPEGSEDGEIKERKLKKSETEIIPVVEPVRVKSPVRQKSVERKKKKEKIKEPKKKKKDRRRSRSRSESTDRRKKHHSRKYSPSRRNRKRSRSRSRKQHDENGRLSIHERLGPKRGRSRERSDDRAPKTSGGADQKAVYSSGENILVSVNFSRRRKRIAEIAAKRRPVAVINLAVDDDKSPVVEKGDSPKEVINLDEGWSTDDEPVRSKHKEHKEQPSNKKESSSAHKSSKNKETGPKTPPEPQVKFSITARPQLKLKNVLGAHDDDDDDDQPAAQESSKDDKSVAETYDPFNPTASPAQESENEPPPQRLKTASHLPPNTRPLSPPKLLTEMPKLERPPPLVTSTASATAPTPAPASAARPVTEIFPGLPANVANILCSSQLQNVFTPQLSALAMPLLLSMNMQNAVQQAVNSASLAAAPAKLDNGVVDMELESPYSPAASEGDDLFEPPSAKNANKSGVKTAEKFDSLFGAGKREATKPSTKGSTSKAAKKEVKSSVTTNSGKKDISVKIEKNKLKIVGALPNAAVETQVKEKFLKKLNRQERVVEEVKVALKPHYTKKLINKEEYKDILRRAVPKVCHNKSGEINPAKIKGLVNEYVKRVRHERNKTKKV